MQLNGLFKDHNVARIDLDAKELEQILSWYAGWASEQNRAYPADDALSVQLHQVYEEMTGRRLW